MGACILQHFLTMERYRRDFNNVNVLGGSEKRSRSVQCGLIIIIVKPYWYRAFYRFCL